MSIVVRLDGEIFLLCKGADEQVIPNLEPTQNDPELIQKTKQILENYGKVGLRTLCMSMRKLEEEEFHEWLKEFVACADDENDELASRLSRRLETKMKLLGVTAIEDRLQVIIQLNGAYLTSVQAGVTNCIDDLRMAGIQIWVLTGDKCETAINIAKSCHLFNSHLQIIEFNSIDSIKQHLNTNSTVLINAVFSSEIVRLMKEGVAEAFQLINK